MTASEATRHELIEKALAALPEDHETLRVPWRGKQERMPVIRIPLSAVVLNPRSHRIKSQLESNPSARSCIEKDPESVESQNEIILLLRGTPGYEPLRQDLEDEQRDPGIATRNGMLINGNRRAAALIDLGVEFIDVAVLPVDATLGEIYELELDLQVAEDFREDYTFTNELLFIDDLIQDYDRNEEEIALRLRWATPTKQATLKKGREKVQRYVRHLVLIREIQEMSAGAIPLTDFDDAEQALQEFDSAYQKLRDKDPLGARRLKQARTLGLLVDLGYERQREVNSEWVEKYLAEAFEEQEILRDLVAPIASANASHDTVSKESDGQPGTLNVFEDEEKDLDAPPVYRVVDELVRRLGQSAQDPSVKLPTAEGEKEFDRELIRMAISDAMMIAAEDAKSEAKAGSALELPIHLLEGASKQLAKARHSYEAASSQPGFDQQAMEKGVDKVSRAFDALEASVNN